MVFQPKEDSSPAWRKELQGKQLGPEEEASCLWGVSASWCPPSGYVQENGPLEGLEIDREGSHSSPTRASRNWGQMTEDAGLPGLMPGLHYKHSCALGEGPRVKPLADPVWSEAPQPGPAGSVEGDTLSSSKPSPSLGGKVRRKSSSPHPSLPPTNPAFSFLFCIVLIFHSLKIGLEKRLSPVSAGVGSGVISFLIAMLQSASWCRLPVAACPVLNTFSLITAHGA